MDRSRVARGAWGERCVARRYEADGYEVLARNWRVRGGELDLVLARGDELVFCEVKTRTSRRFGHPLEAVDSRKQEFVHRSAQRWLAATGRVGRLRFDVATVDGDGITIHPGVF